MRYLPGFVILFLLGFYGCMIENAKQDKKQELTIISDYLSPSDAAFFKAYESASECTVRIINMSADSIMNMMKHHRLNSGIDIIMLESVVDVKKFHSNKLLHPIYPSHSHPKNTLEKGSSKYAYITYGINPFIVTYPDSIRTKIRTYDDLTRVNYNNTLSEKETLVLLSAAYKQLGKVKANNWIRNFTKHGISVEDSLIGYIPVLTTLRKQKMDKGAHLDRMTYPNEYSTGTFYEPFTICIANQAENYTLAKSFIEHYLKNEENEKLNELTNSLSVFATSKTIRVYSVKSEELLPNYQMVTRVLNKL